MKELDVENLDNDSLLELLNILDGMKDEVDKIEGDSYE